MNPTPGVTAADTAKAYKLAVEGDVNGQVLDVTAEPGRVAASVACPGAGD